MKKKIVSIITMLMMAMAIMPFNVVHAADSTTARTINLTDADASTQIVIAAGESATLDLKGVNLSVSTGSAILNHGNLTIIDSGKTNNGTTTYGSVTSTAKNGAAVATFSGSNTLINGSSTYHSTQWYTIKNLGTLVINGNSIFNSSSTSAACIDNGWYHLNTETIKETIDGTDVTYVDGSAFASLTINSGTIIGNVTDPSTASATSTTTGIKGDYYSTTVVNNGTVKDVRFAIYGAGENTEFVINGGTFTGTRTAVESTEANKMSIYGGTFSATGDSYGGILNAARAILSAQGSISIYGGSFTGTVETADATSNLALYAGTFNTTSKINGYVAQGSEYDTATGAVSTKLISTITKYVLYKSNPGDVTFNYNISNVAGNTTGGNVIQKASKVGTTTYEEVYDGVDADQVKFTNSGTTAADLTFDVNDFNSGKLAEGNVPSKVTIPTTTPNAPYYFASKELSLDFSGVSFPTPGIYRYKMKEESTNDKVAATGVLYFDVWVIRGSNTSTDTKAYNTLSVSSIIAHTDTALALDSTNTVANKTDISVSISVNQAMNLTIKHYALGNQASKTENYKYTLTINNATKGSTIAYVRNDGSQGSITITNDGSSTYDFYLKDKEAITFKSISEFPGYSVTADETTMKAEDLKTATKIEYYQLANDSTSLVDSTTTTVGTSKTTTTGKGGTSTTADTKTSNTTNLQAENTDISLNGVLASDTSVTAQTAKYEVVDTDLTADSTIVFSIYKQGTVPTGVILTVAPYAVVVLAGFFGLIVFAIKRRNKDEEEA